MDDFYNGGLWGKSFSFVGFSWNFVSWCIKNVDTHHESFSSKKQVLKKLSPKSLWQTYMKWTVYEVTWAGKVLRKLSISNSACMLRLASRITPCRDFCCSLNSSPSQISTFPLALIHVSSWKKDTKTCLSSKCMIKSHVRAALSRYYIYVFYNISPIATNPSNVID